MEKFDGDDRTPSHAPLTKETVVGHYRIIEKIGSGRIGEIYLANDAKLDCRWVQVLASISLPRSERNVKI